MDRHFLSVAPSNRNLQTAACGLVQRPLSFTTWVGKGQDVLGPSFVRLARYSGTRIVAGFEGNCFGRLTAGFKAWHVAARKKLATHHGVRDGAGSIGHPRERTSAL